MTIKISALPAVVTPLDTDEFETNQGGTSKKETRAQIRAGLLSSVTFLALTDTPSSYSGAGSRFVAVKATEDGLEFVAAPGGGDMLASTYDPQAIAADAFARANHTGTEPDAAIAESNVTQHRAALLPIQLSEIADAAAWTFVVRNAATAGDLTAAAVANFNTEASPAAGMWLIGFLSTGEIRKFDVGAVGGGETNTASNQGTDGVGVWDAKVGVDLQFRHIAPASNKLTVVLNGKDIDLDVVEGNFAIPGENITSGSIADARITSSSVRQHQKFYKPINGTAAGSNITTINSTHAGQRIKIDQNLTLDNAFPAEQLVGIKNVHASNSSIITVEAGAGGTGTINGQTTFELKPGAEIVLLCEANAGDEPQCDAIGDEPEVDFGGRQVKNGNYILADDEETASFTFDLTHIAKMVRANHATVAITATVPANATTAFPIGTTLNITQWGAIGVTIAAAGGVTINKAASKTLVLAEQYGVATLWKQGTDTWLLFGALTDA